MFAWLCLRGMHEFNGFQGSLQRHGPALLEERLGLGWDMMAWGTIVLASGACAGVPACPCWGRRRPGLLRCDLSYPAGLLCCGLGCSAAFLCRSLGYSAGLPCWGTRVGCARAPRGAQAGSVLPLKWRNMLQMIHLNKSWSKQGRLLRAPSAPIPNGEAQVVGMESG